MYIPSSRSGVRIMQTGGKKACFQFPECSLFYTKLMRGERNSKAGKPCFTGLDIAEPKLIFYKDTQISLFSPSHLFIITTLE